MATTPQNNGLTWDAPTMPHEYANLVIVEKTVILVRHHFADTGDVEKIYNDYVDEKVAKIDEK